MAESIFDVSRETLIAATFWTKYVTSRNYFPVEGKLSNAILAWSWVIRYIKILLLLNIEQIFAI